MAHLSINSSIILILANDFRSSLNKSLSWDTNQLIIVLNIFVLQRRKKRGNTLNIFERNHKPINQRFLNNPSINEFEFSQLPIVIFNRFVECDAIQ